MGAESKKQREIAEREQQIVETGKRMLLAGGFRTLTIDRLAAELGISKGTVYNHYANKEDLVLAISTRAWQRRRQLFATAALLDRRSRFRMLAIGAACETFFTRFHDDFQIESWMRNAHILEKASDKVHAQIVKQEQSCMGIVAGVVRDAVAAGDLPVAALASGEMEPEEIVFGFWSIFHGSQILADTSPSLKDLGIRRSLHVTRQHAHLMLEAMGWKPRASFDECVAAMDGFASELVRRVP